MPEKPYMRNLSVGTLLGFGNCLYLSSQIADMENSMSVLTAGGSNYHVLFSLIASKAAQTSLQLSLL